MTLSHPKNQSILLRIARIIYFVTITTDNQQFPKIKIRVIFDSPEVAGSGRGAAANLNGHETGNGGYSQGNT